MRDVRLPEPEALVDAYPHQLSGGQRQRIMIAMALVLQPALLIADEPTTALDVTTQAQILRLIKDLQRERGTGVLFITHDFGVVAEIADRVAVMQTGRIVEAGEARQVLSAPEHPYTRMLISAVPSMTPRPRRRGRRRAGRAGDAWALRKPTAPAACSAAGRVVEAAKNVELVDPARRDARHRRRIRLRQVDRGALHRAADRAERRADPGRRRRHRAGAGPAPAPPPPARPDRVPGPLPLAQSAPHGSASRSSRGRSTSAWRRQDAWQRASELMALVGLDPKALDRYPHQFSGGQRQRICIARALAMQPEVLIADEAVSALDVSVQAQVLDLLDQVRRRFDLAMLFITHDLRVAAQVCDQVAVMFEGEVVEQGSAAEVFGNPRHAYTRALLDAAPGRDWQFGKFRAA